MLEPQTSLFWVLGWNLCDMASYCVIRMKMSDVFLLLTILVLTNKKVDHVAHICIKLPKVTGDSLGFLREYYCYSKATSQAIKYKCPLKKLNSRNLV